METEFEELAGEIFRSRSPRGTLREFGSAVVLRAAIVVVLELGTNNAVFIRGQGGGLRWDKGQPLTCIGPRRWIWSSGSFDERVEFELLLNDQVWARGERIVLESGHTIEITPDFEWPEIPRVATDSCDAGSRAGD